MDSRLLECLCDNYGSYIAPFFWQHGGSHESLLAEIDAIQKSNIREFCVESRIHDDFGKEKWWEDFGFILEEARKRNMKVWLLDDKAFPTGFANGIIKDGSELVRKLLREEHMDILGPQANAAVLANRLRSEGEKLLQVIACKRSGIGEQLYDETMILTPNVRDSVVYFDVPEGIWRVFFLIQTRGDIIDRGRDRYYIDMLSKKSCHAMIESVYEPHLKHFGQYFNNTFVGFFSDEPSFRNEDGTYLSKLGKAGMVIPWTGELVNLIAESQNVSYEKIWGLIPGLWYDIGKNTSLVRYSYMDIVTKLYRENFSDVLGEWCRSNHVMYIGHVIEDMNAHMRLGFGGGHFFRAMAGQDMSGLDVVLHQIMPGISEMTHFAPIVDNGIADPEFFNYALAKLGSSLAHVDPLKKDRCMCEIFGAYGWAEGLPVMKYLADHMLVNGINFFVPHAFSPIYPNTDCPPHFWAGGSNPQFTHFGLLMKYMGKIAHVLSGGTHRADCAVFYNAEGEWCGGKNMLFQVVAKQLTQNQIDFDFIPSDTLLEGSARVIDNELLVNKEKYKALIVPYSEVLPGRLLEKMKDFADSGLKVIFTDALPSSSIENNDMNYLTEDSVQVVPLQNIAANLKSLGFYQVSTNDSIPYLRFYHSTRGESEVFMFFNESLFKDINTGLKVPFEGDYLIYEPWSDNLRKAKTENNKIRLVLSKQSSIIVIFGGKVPDDIPLAEYDFGSSKVLDLKFDIYIKDTMDTSFTLYARKSKLINLSGPDHMPRFCGYIKYKTDLEIENGCHYSILDLGQVGDTAQLLINGQNCGTRIQEPYSFDIRDKLKYGNNRIEIIVINNPAYRERDYYSKFMGLPPSGIMGDITIR